MNTPFIDLYYYHFKSTSRIDKAINNALSRKKKFNERAFAPEFKKEQIQNDNVIKEGTL